MDSVIQLMQDVWNAIVANKEIIIFFIAVFVVGGLLVKGLRSIAGVVAGLFVVLLLLSYCGVTPDDIRGAGQGAGEWMSTITQKVSDKWEEISPGVNEIRDKINEWLQNAMNPPAPPDSTGEADSSVAPPDPPAESQVEASPIVMMGDAEIHYIDVGQADCELIIDGDDVMLIDCGNYADADTVVQYIDGLGIDNIDYFVGTHPHEDHIGCAATVLRSFDVERAILSPATNTTVCYTKMMEEIDKRNVSVVLWEAGDKYRLGNGEFEILAPTAYVDGQGLNNASVVVRYVYGDTAFLFTGDAEAEEEQSILAEGRPIWADVLKVGHHGSATSTSEAFLAAVAPQKAVICVGTDNPYGHPHKETLDMMSRSGVEVYRTDKSGTIVMTTDGKTISVDTEY